ncbi:unnamed protein product [Diplocarpon coronariae]
MNSSIFMKGSFATRARVKLWAHAAALTLSVIVTAIAAARMLISNSQRKNTPTTGGKRSSSGQVALSMGAKSIFFILYQILNEHTSMFKERPKANMILAIIDGISWPAVVAFTVQGVMKKCDGTTCTLSWIIIPLGVINSIISQVGAAVTFGDYKWFKQTGVLPSQLRDDRDLKMGPPAEAPRTVDAGALADVGCSATAGAVAEEIDQHAGTGDGGWAAWRTKLHVCSWSAGARGPRSHAGRGVTAGYDTCQPIEDRNSMLVILIGLDRLPVTSPAACRATPPNRPVRPEPGSPGPPLPPAEPSLPDPRSRPAASPPSSSYTLPAPPGQMSRAAGVDLRLGSRSSPEDEHPGGDPSDSDRRPGTAHRCGKRRAGHQGKGLAGHRGALLRVRAQCSMVESGRRGPLPVSREHARRGQREAKMLQCLVAEQPQVRWDLPRLVTEEVRGERARHGDTLKLDPDECHRAKVRTSLPPIPTSIIGRSLNVADSRDPLWAFGNARRFAWLGDQAALRGRELHYLIAVEEQEKVQEYSDRGHV